MLDLCLSRFVCFVTSLFFRESRMVAPFFIKIKTWQVLRTSCWVLLHVLLRGTHGILKLAFSTGVLSCRRIAFQFSRLKV